MNDTYKTIEEATRELGFGDKVEYPWATFDIKWEALSNEELTTLYNYYFKYVQQLEKEADDRENPDRSKAIWIYDKAWELLSDIIEQIAYRAGLDEEWDKIWYYGDGQITTWNIFTEKAFAEINKMLEEI